MIFIRLYYQSSEYFCYSINQLMTFEDIIKQIALEFIQAWNKQDYLVIKKLLHMDVTLISPTIQFVWPEKKEGIHGRDELLEYFRKLHDMIPGRTVNIKRGELKKIEEHIHYLSQLDSSEKVQVIFKMDQYCKIISLEVSYLE
mgnify:CR=1 FL=1